MALISAPAQWVGAAPRGPDRTRSRHAQRTLLPKFTMSSVTLGITCERSESGACPCYSFCAFPEIQCCRAARCPPVTSTPPLLSPSRQHSPRLSATHLQAASARARYVALSIDATSQPSPAPNETGGWWFLPPKQSILSCTPEHGPSLSYAAGLGEPTHSHGKRRRPRTA